jgi:hypothetical protein
MKKITKISLVHVLVCVCMCVCVRACVRVCEREREMVCVLYLKAVLCFFERATKVRGLKEIKGTKRKKKDTCNKILDIRY